MSPADRSEPETRPREVGNAARPDTAHPARSPEGVAGLRGQSLRQQLLIWLAIPLALLLVAGTLFSYWVALRSATITYDRALLDPALALAEHVDSESGNTVLDLPKVAQDVLRIDSYDRIYFSVSRLNGELLAGQPELPPPPPVVPVGHRTFYDGTVNAERVRIAALYVPQPNGPVVIQVAETMVKRNRLTREILIGETIPDLMVATMAMVLVWFGILRSLAPLERLRSEIAQRSARDLRPLDGSYAPTEVRPLVATLNDLLGDLRDALDAQQRFTANAAHQLRTPLAGLQTQVELALRQPAPEPMLRSLHQLRSATVRAAHLANQLLALSRAEPGGHRPDALRALDLRSVAQDAASLWVPRALAKDLDLGFELEAAPIVGDARLLRDLLDNLIENAIRYTPAGGSITVRTAVESDNAVLSVVDDGPGIPSGQREQVFQRFYRAPGTIGDGSGLGLAIVQEIANVHAARVTIDDGPAGRGTLIRASFAKAPPGSVPAARRTLDLVSPVPR
ncbi:MAG: sensor histidine kinase N-terminal domain-containing protein [Rhodocyclaceae bacterium]|jgi:two-component system sensor histidine kinase TctE|nr:sensor histidine kinase N-terminal domain-containing protein [Rhodocyclaceae bacterium]MCA3073054.1 sensor histidine kinase N-terminal domain-containing protein [Rhodocyclaceae bacterium]MCA3088670.1 sensor histidine kinase N-terminal domain-containing protein [Rhodocyclaceae bacterium]MCA3092546.1 sensor histidine kinase N-terminal domain-containing protein [Rhodocyclaceae bacterium]MCA3098667.1 sensor histidine kinase N-terminal domain-containing protein [Rhodocyclaceae bacterium]